MGIRAAAYAFLTYPLVEKAVATFVKEKFFSLQGLTYAPRAAPDRIKAALFWGIYEYPERYLISKYLPTYRHVVEMGSSLGIVTKTILSKVEKNQRVVSIDANAALKDYWRKNVLNGKLPQRACLEIAMISYSSNDFFCAATNNLNSRVTRDDKQKAPPRTTLGGILERHGLTDAFSLIMDIEGMEFQLLRNEAEVLRKAAFVCAELHGSEGQNKQFAEEMSRLGFMLCARKHSVFAWTKEAFTHQ